jgi:putative radical SAM enzyme (TIGR03279 family)
MRQPRPAQVEQVRPGSPAAAAGIAAGDRVLRVNGRVPRDYIEWRYLTAETRVSLLLKDRMGRRRRLSVEKALDEDLGLRFTRDVFDGIRSCRNRCSFCFVAQLPKGLRPALYVRDDDYRLSYLHGNFITLTNLTPADRARIVRWHLSPLYVSVHATEPEVREKLFGRPTPDVVVEMGRLAARGIAFHAQIVVCPGVNDGRHLERTVRDLAALYPGVRSVGVVPVGLTRHRRGLAAVRPVSARLAAKMVEEVQAWQREFRRRVGSRVVFAADELYLLAGLAIPPRSHYEGFWQLGNGIGGVRLFLEELKRVAPPRLGRPLKVTLATGEGAAELVKLLAEKLEAGKSVRAEVCVVRNRLLGRSITTAGLLAGRDIARALKQRELGDVVLAPASAVREGEGFLDGMTVERLSRVVGVPVLIAGSPRQAVAALRAFESERRRR